MKLPFPGMDPYIEARGLWEDFHPKLIGEIERALSGVLPDRYFIQLGERSCIVLVEEGGKERKQFIPDLGLATPSASDSGARPGAATAVAGAEMAGAVTMRAFIDEHHR